MILICVKVVLFNVLFNLPDAGLCSFTVRCKRCMENILVPVGTMPDSWVVAACPLGGAKRRYLPAEIFRCKLSHKLVMGQAYKGERQTWEKCDAPSNERCRTGRSGSGLLLRWSLLRHLSPLCVWLGSRTSAFRHRVCKAPLPTRWRWQG